jgi:hypothetical protein
MGAIVPAATAAAPVRKLDVRVVATAAIDHLDIVRAGAVSEYIVAKDTIAHVQRELRDLRAGEYVYVRVVQADGGAAWSSPFFVE